jgi:hypothetical protein
MDKTDGNRFPSSLLNTRIGRQPRGRAQQLAPNADRRPQTWSLSFGFSASSLSSSVSAFVDAANYADAAGAARSRSCFQNRTKVLAKPPDSRMQELQSEPP